jgi:hypothetical protein
MKNISANSLEGYFLLTDNYSYVPRFGSKSILLKSKANNTIMYKFQISYIQLTAVTTRLLQ